MRNNPVDIVRETRSFLTPSEFLLTKFENDEFSSPLQTSSKTMISKNNLYRNDSLDTYITSFISYLT